MADRITRSLLGTPRIRTTCHRVIGAVTTGRCSRLNSILRQINRLDRLGLICLCHADRKRTPTHDNSTSTPTTDRTPKRTAAGHPNRARHGSRTRVIRDCVGHTRSFRLGHSCDQTILRVHRILGACPGGNSYRDCLTKLCLGTKRKAVTHVRTGQTLRVGPGSRITRTVRTQLRGTATNPTDRPANGPTSGNGPTPGNGTTGNDTTPGNGTSSGNDNKFFNLFKNGGGW